MNVIQEINRINQRELQEGLTNTSASWHAKYSSSAWVYVGNLPTPLTEGDILAVMSQFGEIEDINLVREEGTGKSRGFCFVKYEDCRSCVLAVDNFNGTMVLGRSLRVDHVENYRLPKHLREKEERGGDDDDNADANADANATEEEGQNERIDQHGHLKAGHAYHGKQLANEYDINQGHDLFAPVYLPVQNNMNGHTLGDDQIGREQKQDAKLQRKAERDRIRKEREARKQEKEEERRQKRAKTIDNKRGKKDGHPDDNRDSNRDDNKGRKRAKTIDNKGEKDGHSEDNRDRSRNDNEGRKRAKIIDNKGEKDGHSEDNRDSSREDKKGRKHGHKSRERRKDKDGSSRDDERRKTMSRSRSPSRSKSDPDDGRRKRLDSE